MELKKSNFKSELCCKQHTIERKGQMGDLCFNWLFHGHCKEF